MKLFNVLLIIGASWAVSDSTAKAQSAPLPYPQVGLSFGYGNLGGNGRIDVHLTKRYLGGSSTRIYLDIGGQSVSFKEKNFLVSGIEYPSDCRLISIGVGIAQEFHIENRVVIMPFLGVRNELVRFKNQQLVDMLDGKTLQRFADTAMTRPIGPPIEDAYGDAAALDLGCRFGIILSRRVEISLTAAWASISFDSGETLFGQYRGEAPYENPYWVRRANMRYEIALRFILKRFE